MAISYSQISKEVGYIGQMTFPPMEELTVLADRLSSNPTILDFKKALGLYRFTPEVETREQQKMIYMLELGLSEAREILFSPEVKPSYAEVAVNYLMNLIPSLAVIYLVAQL